MDTEFRHTDTKPKYSIRADISLETMDSTFLSVQIRASAYLSDEGSTVSTESTESTESFEKPPNPKSKYNALLKLKKHKEKQKEKTSVVEYCDYDSSTVSKFSKDSPFISMLINRRIKINDNGCSSHIAAFVPDLNVENKRSCWALGKFAIGENSERNRYGNNHLSTHAEMDALKKLDNLFRVTRCKKQSMDLVVLRVNKSGNLCESAPCYHCTQELNNFQKKKDVSFNKLYFSRWDGTITCIKFADWVRNDQTRVSTGWKWLSCKSGK
jgi:hypothetical protein